MNSRIRVMVLTLVWAATSTILADEQSHRAAAEDLLQLSNTEKAMQTMMEQMLAAQVKADPRLEPFKDTLRKFMTKHLGYAALKGELITLYVAEFSEPELKEVAAFYRTPTGKKLTEKVPMLMQQGGVLGQKRVQANLPELQQMIRDEVEKKRTNAAP